MRHLEETRLRSLLRQWRYRAFRLRKLDDDLYHEVMKCVEDLEFTMDLFMFDPTFLFVPHPFAKKAIEDAAAKGTSFLDEPTPIPGMTWRQYLHDPQSDEIILQKVKEAAYDLGRKLADRQDEAVLRVLQATDRPACPPKIDA